VSQSRIKIDAKLFKDKIVPYSWGKKIEKCEFAPCLSHRCSGGSCERGLVIFIVHEGHLLTQRGCEVLQQSQHG
jgi:hypothetical protein